MIIEVQSVKLSQLDNFPSTRRDCDVISYKCHLWDVETEVHQFELVALIYHFPFSLKGLSNHSIFFTVSLNQSQKVAFIYKMLIEFLSHMHHLKQIPTLIVPNIIHSIGNQFVPISCNLLTVDGVIEMED